jgi:hypothetical protein
MIIMRFVSYGKRSGECLYKNLNGGEHGFLCAHGGYVQAFDIQSSITAIHKTNLLRKPHVQCRIPILVQTYNRHRIEPDLLQSIPDGKADKGKISLPLRRIALNMGERTNTKRD